ncbi:MAG: hypothetical protein AAGE65_05075 [Planctomycetota bacterium]
MTSDTGYRESVFVTSADLGRPAELVVVPGTPVVDTADQVFGVAVAVTSSFCLMCPHPHPPRARDHEDDEGEMSGDEMDDLPGVGGAVYAVAWRDVAVGNVCAAPAALPRSVRRRDQGDSYALILQYIDHAQAFGALKVLRAARRTLLRKLTRR